MITRVDILKIKNHSASSSSSPASSTAAAAPVPSLSFFLLVLPGRPPPWGEVLAKSICFSESTFTMNEGMLTIWGPTLQKLTIVVEVCLPDVPVPDEDPGLVDGLSLVALEDLGLETPLHELGHRKTKNVIKFIFLR